MNDKFTQSINSGYAFEGETITMGCAMFNGDSQTGTLVKVPLKTLNRHGLIAGATGTGKTKTLQYIAEQLSKKGVPSLLMDIKGDLSGIAAEGSSNPKIEERHKKIGSPWSPNKSPVDFYSLSDEKGARLRATVSEFGPVLFSRILGLNDTQQSVVSVIFKYCDDKELPLLDLKDFKKVLNYISNEGKDEIGKEYGAIAGSSVGTIIRNVIELEQQGAEKFFGERSFDVDDLCRYDDEGKGIISIVRLCDIQNKPALFSTFMMQLLAEIYSTFPEEGDADRPKLVLFIDEAHLIFREASKSLLEQIDVIIKLIRSKGVGIFFITQTPTDIPENILGQLGLKVQHALRAFTANDRKAIKTAAENFPETDFYKTDEILTSMGIGEALVTALNEKGIPTPLAHTLLCAAGSRMDVLEPSEIDAILAKSFMVKKYNEVVDRESAYEILAGKIEAANSAENQKKLMELQEKADRQGGGRQEKSTFEEVMDSTVTRQIGRTVARELTRGLLGALGVRNSTTRRRKPKSALDMLFS
jgi:DNA helicase HerA-like ATPase